MKRIDIIYDGHTYSVGGRELEELQEEITAGLADGPHWVRVNDGEGDRREAYLLMSPGAPIALIPIPEGESGDLRDEATWHVQGQGEGLVSP